MNTQLSSKLSKLRKKISKGGLTHGLSCLHFPVQCILGFVALEWAYVWRTTWETKEYGHTIWFTPPL